LHGVIKLGIINLIKKERNKSKEEEKEKWEQNSKYQGVTKSNFFFRVALQFAVSAELVSLMSTYNKHFRRFEHDTFIDPILIAGSSFAKTVKIEVKETDLRLCHVHTHKCRSICSRTNLDVQ
jgi:hypothetical protein